MRKVSKKTKNKIRVFSISIKLGEGDMQCCNIISLLFLIIWFHLVIWIYFYFYSYFYIIIWFDLYFYSIIRYEYIFTLYDSGFTQYVSLKLKLSFFLFYKSRCENFEKLRFKYLDRSRFSNISDSSVFFYL